MPLPESIPGGYSMPEAAAKQTKQKRSLGEISLIQVLF